MMTCWKDRIKIYNLTFLFLLILLQTACKKDVNNEVGSDIIGDRAGFDVKVTDTFDIVAFSAKADSFDTRYLGYYMLGQMYDPELGISTANITLQYGLPVANFSFGGATIDSVVLQLRYAGPLGIYGNAKTPQTIRVYEIAEDLPAYQTSPYFTNRTYTKGALIGEYLGTFNITDSANYQLGDKTILNAPQLRIKLSSQQFINRLQNADASTFTNNANFKAAFKGLYISAEQSGMVAGDGAMTYINFRSDNFQTAVVVYFKQNNVPVKYEFPVNGFNEVKANEFRQKQTPELQYSLSGTHRNVCYVQPGAGIKTRIMIPGLAQLAKNNLVSVLGAKIQLVLKDTGLSKTNYPPPSILRIRGTDEFGRNKIIQDNFEASSVRGGSYDESINGYWFNVTREVQRILSTYNKTGEDTNLGFNIITAEDDVSLGITANRAIFNTDKNNTSTAKMKLILTYSVIK